MFKYGHTDISRNVYIDPLPLGQVDDYPLHHRMTRRGVTIDIHSDHLNLKRLPRRFTVYGFDPNSMLANHYGEMCYQGIFEMPLSRRTVNGVQVYHPDYTQLSSAYQGLGLMPHIYKQVMRVFGIRLVTGDGQSPGSVKLWYRLAGLRGVEINSYKPREGWVPAVRNHKAQELSTLVWDPYEYDTCRCVASVS